MSDVGELLQNVWNQAHQERIVKGIVGFAVSHRLSMEAPKVLKLLEAQRAKLEARLAALERRRGIRV